jgi:predicted extracellular nuclease
MKRFVLPLLAAAYATLLWVGSAAGAVIISEYVEGSSNNKGIELYNTSASPVDLSRFRLLIYFNGSATPASTILLGGSLAGGEAWVLAHVSAAFASSADQTSNALSFNGDDALVLEVDGIVVDSIGQVGVDPGPEWGTGSTSTQDNTLRRMPQVLAGDTDPSDAFDPSVQWLGFATNTFGGLGTHVVVVPEPESWLVLLAGLALLGVACRRRTLRW